MSFDSRYYIFKHKNLLQESKNNNGLQDQYAISYLTRLLIFSFIKWLFQKQKELSIEWEHHQPDGTILEEKPL